MAGISDIRRRLFGAPLNPQTRHNIALAAFFAWVGLGADGISSSCYGPEEAFRALGDHPHLGLYLALATAATVFLIALAYNQVIELFPTGGGGLHALLWVQRLFPNHFGNFVFVNARTVDSKSYGGQEDVESLKVEANSALSYSFNFCHSKGWAAKSYLSFGTDPIEEFTRLAERVEAQFSNAIFFTSNLIFEVDNLFIRLLHNQAALALQRRFHLRGMQMVILPMKLNV